MNSPRDSTPETTIYKPKMIISQKMLFLAPLASIALKDIGLKGVLDKNKSENPNLQVEMFKDHIWFTYIGLILPEKQRDQLHQFWLKTAFLGGVQLSQI